MFEMGKETIALPLVEKLKFEQGDQGISFGYAPSFDTALSRRDNALYVSYKAAGVQFMDDRGTRDVTEFINVSRDDAMAWTAIAHRT